MSGVATTISNSNQFSPCIFWTNSSAPTKSAPAASASAAFAPLAKTKTLLVLPVPCGNTTAPLTCWSACLESTPNFIWASTVSSNLAVATSATKDKASVASYNLVLSILFNASTYFLLFFAILFSSLWLYSAFKPPTSIRSV